MRRRTLVLSILMVALSACAGNDVIDSGPSGSDAVVGPTIPATPQGFLTCERAGLYELAHPEDWEADDQCSTFTPPAPDPSEGSSTPAITIEALGQTFDEVVTQEPAEGALREEVSIASARAERLLYASTATDDTAGGEAPIVRYTLDLVPGPGVGETSEEQTLVITAAVVPGTDAPTTMAVLENMLQSLRITAYLPERGDPPQ